MAKLTDRQKRFCDEYLIDLNATQAAIRAGYSEKRPSEQAYQLLQKATVQEYIQKRQADRVERTEISQDDVVKELANIAFSNVTDYVKVVEKEMHIEVEGKLVPVYDEDGNPAKYKTVEPILTDELTEQQKKALAVIQKGRDGFIIKTYDKLQALEKLGKHLGMWNNKENESTEMQDDGFMDALRSEVGDTWAEE